MYQKKYLAVLLVASMFNGQASHATTCIGYYNADKSSLLRIKDKSISAIELKQAIKKNTPISGFITTSDKRRINVKFTPGDLSLPMALAIHGLGDKKESLDPLISAFKSLINVPVLSLDTNLSGESLKAFLQDNKNEVPKVFSYQKDVADISEIVKSVGRNELFVLGHSKGGGLGYETSVSLKKDGIEILGLIPMAPYAQDGFKYSLSLLMSFNLPAELLQKLTNELSGIPVVGGPIEDSLKPFINTLGTISNQFREGLVGYFDYFSRFMGLPTTEDLIRTTMTPSLNDFMQRTYTEYFTEIAEKELNRPLNKKEYDFIQKQVDASISLTNGLLRNDNQEALDLLDGSKPLKIDPSIPVLLMVGQEDPLVTPPQMNLLKERLVNNGNHVTVYEVKNKGHFFPQQDPTTVATQIAEFMLKQISAKK
ncbi:MAG: alpha/beta hydrolase [Bdellovibrionaceae bacterium]|nr:alpha/beta hydrolase [Pseudobdellovibrionaceae bacterium]NUM59711.1 alpha/beta hydrolase [Pseudobdellovibrionaceae bacterium]